MGPYEIVERIGAGGMGEVYRAVDSRMGREVALKVSAERFSDRFSREVRAVASLNHPNVCTLHDVGENYLVMELIEGSTLAERIAHGPIPLEEALATPRQIALALEAAHEKGIVHRDLKPGNIKIKPDGAVKVLDFGLAKVAEASPAGTSEVSPTISLAATQGGIILGTAAYMSPEQACGRAVDKRTDIWAFGVVLHEMLTGRRLFEGEDVTETLASVVKDRPDLTAIPAPVRPLLERCLEKDPKKRLRDIGDMGLLLAETPARVAPQSPLRSTRFAWAAGGAAGLALGSRPGVGSVDAVACERCSGPRTGAAGCRFGRGRLASPAWPGCEFGRDLARWNAPGLRLRSPNRAVHPAPRSTASRKIARNRGGQLPLLFAGRAVGRILDGAHTEQDFGGRRRRGPARRRLQLQRCELGQGRRHHRRRGVREGPGAFSRCRRPIPESSRDG